ncbi:FecR family protein [Dyadobacter subterraneus]|uniref:FecR family protein n=1 Tax=Dyadobacter subterraneus TaxID=2773304 RepID=A0ABR9WBU5_9BACT|nr:FecR family protein [Dyadobacter subterraneus]MBE9462935.1 FecR family protein [Dyadobacter subterraneus]
MINYRNYSVEEFATDEKFRQWVLDPSGEVIHFWETWLLHNPDRHNTVNQATELVLGIHEKYKDDLSEESIQAEINALVELAELSKKKKRFAFLNNPFWRAAAMVALISGLGYFYYYNHLIQRPEKVSYTDMLVKRNLTNKEMTILLNDGSVATLKKGSSLKYPAKFSGDTREVFLTGEAFFDVTKNPTQPFLVYANETVTKVLGTSFRVKAPEGENTVMVFVKTGKVSVYPKKEYETLSNQTDHEVSGVILQPNQQVAFYKKENRLEKGIVENPDLLSESALNQELIFDDQPVSDVLRTLEKMYGIAIMFDEESLSQCPISTTFKEENLKQRMNAICQAIGATYEVVDGQIILNSKGCSH